jgi:hypothetical protein
VTPGLRDPRDPPGAPRDRTIWIGIGWQLEQVINNVPSLFHWILKWKVNGTFLCFCWRCRALRMIRFGPGWCDRNARR